MKKQPDQSEENEKEIPVCEKCGSVMIFEDNEWVCPHCDGDINFFGDDNE